MFNSYMKAYSRKIYSVQTDSYGQEIPTYTKGNDIVMFISLLNHNQYTQNDMRIMQATHTGITYDTVAVGDIIGDQYTVEFINEAGRENLVYLKEIESNGSHS